MLSGMFPPTVSPGNSPGHPWNRPERPERAYMDILRNIQRTREVLTPAVH